MSEYDVCRSQTLTYQDDPCIERIKIFIMVVAHNIGINIQMNHRELAKTFMMISN